MAAVWARPFRALSIEDVAEVGGKNASLGEMIRELSGLGVAVPDGFAITASAYRRYVEHNGLGPRIEETLASGKADVGALTARARELRAAFVAGEVPPDVQAAIEAAYAELRGDGPAPYLAVRSSATAEDLPGASFAGQQETFLMVHGAAELDDAVRRAFASLFTARAISYREDMGFSHLDVALSIGVQVMVRSDVGVSGVMFTLDTETGHPDIVLISSTWGLGENIVQGRVEPDEISVHKPTLAQGFRSVIRREIGSKEFALRYDVGAGRLRNEPVPLPLRKRMSLGDDDALELARWAVRIESHYSERYGKPTPMDIEWAKDGLTGALFIVQARPETVHAMRGSTFKVFELEERSAVLAEGIAVGDAVATGVVRVIRDPADMERFEDGDVLVSDITDPDWEPVMKRASAIVTNHGGRTSHAAIVARELGLPAVVGAGDATDKLRPGAQVTISTVEGTRGYVYDGALAFAVEEIDPAALPTPKTDVMLNVGNPEQALRFGLLPAAGVGLARMEFIFASWVKVHPLALTRFASLAPELRDAVNAATEGYDDKTEYFVDRLSQGIATIAAAFWPRPVILRLSDFKTNEYAHLLGGAPFEPTESNPMIGWRGASRYYHPDYKEGFLLEVRAIRRVRDDMGLTNLKLMVPFCRTPDEGRKVLAVMAEGGLVRGEGGLEVYVMAEIPSNIWLAHEFAKDFDGFSIGSNDLTQLTFGVDRDSEKIAALFDDRGEAIRMAASMLIEKAHAQKRKVGICGQAPSDDPEFAAFLVKEGIDSVSVTPDALLKTLRRLAEVGG